MKTMPPHYTDEDANAYTRILLLTGVHRKRFDPQQAGRFTSTQKYKNVISPLLKAQGRDATTGEGYKLVTDQSKDYVYYNNPNDLVERLRLLVAAEQAGNMNHHNEIESILQELEELGIISV